VRPRLADLGETRPDRPAPRPRPPARPVCDLMRKMAVVTLQGARRASRQVTPLHAHQLHVIGLRGDDPPISGIPHRNAG
jgi:hypothetical protein